MAIPVLFQGLHSKPIWSGRLKATRLTPCRYGLALCASTPTTGIRLEAGVGEDAPSAMREPIPDAGKRRCLPERRRSTERRYPKLRIVRALARAAARPKLVRRSRLDRPRPSGTADMGA